MRGLIVGALGEVGAAHLSILKDKYETFGIDLKESKESEIKDIEILHIAIRYGESFIEEVQGYIRQFQPKLVNILSTVPPGTTEMVGPNAVHSTTRGLHPHLRDGLLHIPKHIGGPASRLVAGYFSEAGIPCITHKRARTTEVAHIAHLVNYGIQLVAADIDQNICRLGGVDYLESVIKYRETHNRGFRALDMDGKSRMVLVPPNGHIGGHCVIAAAKMAIEHMGVKNPIVEVLAHYND